MVTDALKVSVDLQPRSAGRCQMRGLEVQVTITPLAAVRKSTVTGVAATVMQVSTQVHF